MSTISLRFDNETKREIDALCEKLGLSITNFFTIFAKKAIREQAIPFEVSAKNDGLSYDDMMQSMDRLQRAAIKNGTANMSLEEINKEIYGK